jgi:hypothetical protein
MYKSRRRIAAAGGEVQTQGGLEETGLWRPVLAFRHVGLLFIPKLRSSARIS